MLRSVRSPIRTPSFFAERFFAATLLVLTITSSGCVDQQAHLDITRLRQELGEMRAIQADHTSQVSQVQGELRTLSGRIDEIEYAQRQRLGGALSDLQKDVSSLRKRVPPPPIVPSGYLEQDEAGVRGLPDSALTIWNEALALIREGKFADALPRLQETLDVAVQTPASPIVVFWIGVAHDGLADSKRALEAYNDIISKYPKSSRVPQALLRQSSVFVRLDDSKTAKLILKKLVGEFPKSPEAAQARERLQKGL